MPISMPVNKVLLEHTMFIYVLSLAAFQGTTAELTSCNRDHIFLQA